MELSFALGILSYSNILLEVKCWLNIGKFKISYSLIQIDMMFVEPIDIKELQLP